MRAWTGRGGTSRRAAATAPETAPGSPSAARPAGAPQSDPFAALTAPESDCCAGPTFPPPGGTAVAVNGTGPCRFAASPAPPPRPHRGSGLGGALRPSATLPRSKRRRPRPPARVPPTTPTRHQPPPPPTAQPPQTPP